MDGIPLEMKIVTKNDRIGDEGSVRRLEHIARQSSGLRLKSGRLIVRCRVSPSDREFPIRLTTPMYDPVALHQGTFGHFWTLPPTNRAPESRHSTVKSGIYPCHKMAYGRRRRPVDNGLNGKLPYDSFKDVNQPSNVVPPH